MAGSTIQSFSTPATSAPFAPDWLTKLGSNSVATPAKVTNSKSDTRIAQTPIEGRIKVDGFPNNPLRTLDQRLDLRLPGAGLRFAKQFGASGAAETQLANLAFMEQVYLTTGNVSGVTSAKEQAQAVHSNLITSATNDVNKLTVMRNQLTAMYGSKLVSAGQLQTSLAKINATLNVVRTSLENNAAMIASMNVRTGNSNFKVEMQRLNKTLGSIRNQIKGQQLAIQTDLKLADAQVAQIQANAANEVSGSKIQLKTAIDSVQQSADRAVTNPQKNSGAAERHSKSGVSLPATMVGTNGPLTREQREKMVEFFEPLAGVSRSKIDKLVPPTKPGEKPVTVDGVPQRVGVADYKANLQRLVTEYKGIDNAAHKLGFKDGKQLTNMVAGIQSGKFDPLKMNADLSTERAGQKKLLSDVGRVRSQFVKKLGNFNFTAQLESIGKEVSAKTEIPPGLKAYAAESGMNVNVLVGMAAFQYGFDKGEATLDFAVETAISTSPSERLIGAKRYVKALADTGKLTPIANSLGNIERVKRIMIQYEALQISKQGYDTAFKNSENAALNYENARGNADATIASTTSAVQRTNTQIDTLEKSYLTAKVARLRGKGNESQLAMLEQQFKLTDANLKRVVTNNEFSLKLAKERVLQTQASGKQRTFSNLALRIVTDIGDWNAKYLSQASTYGVMANGKALYWRTAEGLIIPPTTLRLAMNNRIGTPTSTELKTASELTLKGFSRGPSSRSGDLLSRRTPEAVAAVGVFLRGDPNAFISRSPIQTSAQSPSKVSFGQPTAFTYRQDPKASATPPGDPYIPGVFDPRINPTPEPTAPTQKPKATVPQSDGAKRDEKLGYLMGGGRVTLAQYVDDPAQRAELWTKFGILVKRVGSTDSATYDVFALPAKTLSPGRSGSEAVASQATFCRRVLPPESYPPPAPWKPRTE